MGKKDIKIENINKSYDGVQVLKNINLNIEDGEFFSILGPSGCGKTTLLRMIAGFIEPDSGAIYLGDEDIISLPPNERNVNTIFQKYALFPHLSVYENVAFPLRIKKIDEATIDEEVKKFIKMVGLSEHIYKKPNQLSGGQQQRTAIGRAIVKNPDILLCDEPTGALDYHTSKEILKLIETVNQRYGNTIIMVTHNDAIKDMADRVVKLRDGMIRKNYRNEVKIPAINLEW